MSDLSNPYQSPQTDINPVASSQGGLTEAMITYLREAAPWLRFLGILAFVACGLIASSALLVLAAGRTVWGGAGGWMGAALYLGIAVLSFIPARYTYMFGAKIRAYLRSGMAGDLEAAFRNNKSLWKFMGIMAIIYLALIPVAIVLFIIAAMTAFNPFVPAF